jgi:hypothetical protein
MKLIPSVTLAIRISVLTGLAAQAGAPVSAQIPQSSRVVARLTAEPSQLRMRVGDSVRITVKAFDAQGQEITDATIRVFGARRAVGYQEGMVRAFQAGTFTLTAGAAGASGMPVTLEIPVTVTWPPITRMEIVRAAPSGPVYTGVTLTHGVKGYLMDGTERTGLKPAWKSSNPAVATVDRFGNVRTLAAGSAVISAEAEGMTATWTHTVTANPVRSVVLGVRDTSIRTGDVIPLAATARGANGRPVNDAPIVWSYTYVPDDSIVPAGLPGGAGIIQ